MIIQTAPAGEAALAIMMHEHTALAGQFAHAFGNARFASLEPFELMVYVVSNHDAGWAQFDRDPATDGRTGLPYNLIETPAEHITVTSRRSPDFNERHHPYCGLISSMHSWGLYNGRYGLSKLVLIDNLPASAKPVAERMLEAEVERQKRLKTQLGSDPQSRAWLDEKHVIQNYKQLQFCDTLALYFNRIHSGQRQEQTFEHVPLNSEEDVSVVIRPRGEATYELAPFPFAAQPAEFAYAGRRIRPGQERNGGWSEALRTAPTQWEVFRLTGP